MANRQRRASLGVQLTGYLDKQEKWTGRWIQRFYVLTQHSIHYFKRDADAPDAALFGEERGHYNVLSIEVDEYEDEDEVAAAAASTANDTSNADSSVADGDGTPVAAAATQVATTDSDASRLVRFVVVAADGKRRTHVLRGRTAADARRWRVAISEAAADARAAERAQRGSEAATAKHGQDNVQRKRLKRSNTITGDFRNQRREWPSISSVAAGVVRLVEDEEEEEADGEAATTEGATTTTTHTHVLSEDVVAVLRFDGGRVAVVTNAMLTAASDDVETSDEHEWLLPVRRLAIGGGGVDGDADDADGTGLTAAERARLPSEWRRWCVRVQCHSSLDSTSLSSSATAATTAAASSASSSAEAASSTLTSLPLIGPFLARVPPRTLAIALLVVAATALATAVLVTVTHADGAGAGAGDTRTQAAVAVCVVALLSVWSSHASQQQQQRQQQQQLAEEQQQQQQQSQRHYYLTVVAWERDSRPVNADGTIVGDDDDGGDDDAKDPYSIANEPMPERYVRAEKGNRATAVKRWRATKKWRRRHNVDTCLWTPQPHYFTIKKYYPHFFHKTSRKGFVTYYEQPGLIDMAALQAAGITIDDLLSHYVFITEFLWQVLDPDQEWGQIASVLDVRNIGLRDANGDAMAFVKGALAFVQEHYPDRSAMVFVVNVPSWFNILFKLVRPLMDKVTQAKTHIYRSQFEEELLTHVASEDLPDSLGGVCNCGPCETNSPEERAMAEWVRRLNGDVTDADAEGYGESSVDGCTWAKAEVTRIRAMYREEHPDVNWRVHARQAQAQAAAAGGQ